MESTFFVLFKIKFISIFNRTIMKLVIKKLQQLCDIDIGY
jgi:hypothetical protein